MEVHLTVHTLSIQGQDDGLRTDDGLDHAKILVGRLTLDRCLVEFAEGMHDALLALARRRVSPRDLERNCSPPGARP